MQTPSLPIQVSGASANPAPNRGAQSANQDGAQFSAALSQQIAQRQNPAPKPAAASKPAEAAKPADPAKAADAEQPATNAEASPVADASPAKTSSTDKADKADDSGESGDSSEGDAASLAGTTPVADLLALVASLTLPAQAAPAAAAQVADDVALTGARKAAPDLAAATALSTPGQAETAPSGDPAAALAASSVAQPALAKTASAAAPDDAPFKGLDQLKLAPRISAEPAPLNPKQPVAAGDTPAASVTAMAAVTDPASTPAAPTARAALTAETVPVVALPSREAAPPAVLKEAALVAAPISAQVQQATLALTPQAGVVASDRIAARVGTPAWDNQVSQKIIWMVAGKEQSASLTLNPPDLGPMQVVLSVTNDQASVTFSAHQPEVRQALEDALPKLREMMSDNGIALGNATVNAGSGQQREAYSDSGRTGAGASRGGGQEVQAAPTVAASRASQSGGLGLVDTFA